MTAAGMFNFKTHSHSEFTCESSPFPENWNTVPNTSASFRSIALCTFADKLSAP